MIILHAKNLVPEHDKQVHISYTFARPRMFVEPLMLVLTYFAFFCVCSLLARSGAAPRVKKSEAPAAAVSSEAAN